MKMVRMVSLGMLLSTPALAFGAKKGPPLAFGWDDGMAAHVTYQTEGERSQGLGPLQFSRTLEWDLRVEREGRQLRVHRDDRSLERSAASRAVPHWTVQVLVDDLSEYVPTLVVDDRGQFRGIEGGEAVRAEAGAVLDQTTVGAPTRAQVEAMVSDDSLAALQADYWAFLVQLPQRLPNREGETVTLTNRAPVPALGGAVDLQLTLRMGADVPCTSATDAPECVEVTAVSRPDPEQVASLIGDSGLSELQMEHRMELVTTPDTLRPYHLELTRDLQIRRHGADGDLTDIGSERVTRRWDFVYRD